ncbi:MAG: saccharopine dehydrogenase NADP-binding domain-containing protein [Candidatus Eisenbacteria bacterium]|nr:saccharopine dehydrogenase NADP-binding domain-containing protein [Candidatus Eisenbacteria bacterium]
MNPKTILVLGGYGGTGTWLCRLLARHTDTRVIVAGRRLGRAAALAGELERECATETASPEGGSTASRFAARHADAADPALLAAAFQGVSLVIAASTTAQHAAATAAAALDVGADYLDLHFQDTALRQLEAMDARVRAAGRTCITQGGFHPGLPAALIRLAAARMGGRCRAAAVSMVMTQRVERAESLEELVDVIADFSSQVYRDGEWRKAAFDMKDVRRVDFGPGFGRRDCFPLFLEELRPLPPQLGLERVGVHVAGFNCFVDWVVTPLAYALYRVKRGLGRRTMARLMTWGINTFPPPRQGVVMVVEAWAAGAAQPADAPAWRLVLDDPVDAYHFTAAPVAACVLQWLDGALPGPGVRLMAHTVNPERLLKDLREMGVRVEEGDARGQGSGRPATGAPRDGPVWRPGMLFLRIRTSGTGARSWRRRP